MIRTWKNSDRAKVLFMLNVFLWNWKTIYRKLRELNNAQGTRDLRKRLRELEQNQEQPPFNCLPWIIGGSVLVVGIIIIALIINKNERKY